MRVTPNLQFTDKGDESYIVAVIRGTTSMISTLDISKYRKTACLVLEG